MSSEAEARGHGAGADGGNADVVQDFLRGLAHASTSADGSGHPDGSLGRPGGAEKSGSKVIGQHRRHVHRSLLLLVIGR